MNLHENKNDLKDLISLTAERYSLLEVYVEKDYWVTYILKKIFQSEYRDNIIFKGGTSLSKAYKIIERFSEDIDIQLYNFKGGDSTKKTFMKNIEKLVEEILNYLDKHPRENKHGNIRKTVYDYQSVIEGNKNFFQGSKELIFEINKMSTPEPVESKKINSIIADYLKEKDLNDVIKEYKLESFDVNVLDKRRTFVEKIFAILDFSFAEDYINELSTKIRHIYDVAKLIQDEEVREFFESEEFFVMSNKVVVENDFFGHRKDRVYKTSRFYSEDIFKQLEKTYNNDFSKFVLKDLVEYSKVEKLLNIIFQRISKWEEEYRK